MMTLRLLAAIAAIVFPTFGTPVARPSAVPADQAAIAYCKSTGGVVKVRLPYYNTNGYPQTQPTLLGGSAVFCQYTDAKKASISLFASTLYTPLPSLAALAYYFKPAEPPSCSKGGGNPASCYCSSLGASDEFGGLAGAGGSWVYGPLKNADWLETCVFPDASSIDSWGLLYHTLGIIRGADLSKVLRFKKPRG